MKAYQNSKPTKKDSALPSGVSAPRRSPFGWTAFVSLFILCIGLLASAQEIPCGQSAVSDAPHVRVHAAAQHSEHCIRHQDPLPGFDSAPQTVSGPGTALSKIVVAVLADTPLTYRPEASLYDHGQTPHAGVSVYKIFARFLI